MDPLDEDFAFKYFTKGAPVKVETILNYDIKEWIKSPYIWGPIVAGSLGLAYYLFTSQESDENGGAADNGNNNVPINNSDFNQYNYINDNVIGHQHQHHHNGSGHHQQTTTTTTTTTTSSSSILTSSLAPPLPPPTPIQHVKLNNKSGEPLPLEEQNLLLLKENSCLRGENRDLRVWVSNQLNNINDRMEKMQIDLDREKYCHICEENEKQVCWRECGHRLCARCATLIKKSSRPQCAICRTGVSDFYIAWNT